MLTLALYGLLAILLAGALFLLAAYLLPSGEQIAPPIRDEPEWDLPAGRRLGSADVTAVRLPVALRGYRFAETDRLLDRLAHELDERDAEIARLRGRADEDQERWQPRRTATGPRCRLNARAATGRTPRRSTSPTTTRSGARRCTASASCSSGCRSRRSSPACPG